VVRTEGTCRVNADCSSNLCVRGQCVSCTSNDVCGAGRVCGPDARCVDRNAVGVGGTGNQANNHAGTGAIVLGEGERIQGGACACRVGQPGASSFASVLGIGLAAALGRRRRRAGNIQQGSAK
jgi:MYXO-CTERM domain-containing protein